MSQRVQTHPKTATTIGQPRPPATYGALLAASHAAANSAGQMLAATPESAPPTPVLRDELEGYERFLITATRHIRTLMQFADIPAGPHWSIEPTLEHRPEVGEGTGYWHRAADYLGAALDLVATHFTTAGVPRTPEVTELVLGPPAAGSCAEVTSFMLEAIDSSVPLIAAGARTHERRRSEGPPVAAPIFTRLRQSNRSARRSGRSMMWELKALTDAGGPNLNRLQLAVIASGQRVASFDSSLTALRALREIARRQAVEHTPASPASLRDLTLVADRVLTHAIGATRTQVAAGGLPGLRAAHAVDLLAEARDSWNLAGEPLTTTVRGVTRAPGTYAKAARALLDCEPTAAEETALVTALPSLAQDASRTIEVLAGDRTLATLQFDPLATRPAWRPITPAQRHELVTRFTRAETASQRAAEALLATTPSHRRATQASPSRGVRRSAPAPQVEAPSCTR